ncbi:serine hydrolase [Pseudomonas sp. S60]|uniref:serine hydrolase domain-containing protein n=1 Tax=Pseudomonas sp. S60 TaxID=211124 RepID=UPI001912B48B|nr:serine hydrolase domain-containing protein [Pseudomonas sp. S60]MBK5010954.1 serine hydrolase [Pseudomonas sp. S60]
MQTNLDPRVQVIVQKALDEATGAGGEVGVQVAAYLDGKLVVDAWSGSADPASGRPVDGDTLFNVYSVTKAVAATALHVLAERGYIDYDAPVSRYWPEYAANGKAATTVRHVLTHRAGVPQMPADVTPERLCDWTWMTQAIANLEPLAEPGSQTLYLSMTFGWIVGELVRRADPRQRSLGRFVREEIAVPLGIDDLWIGIPDAVESRIARQVNAMVAVAPEYLPPLFLASMPEQVALVPEVFERADVRRAEVAGVGGIFNARSEARFWAFLANGGELDGVRLLSAERVAMLGQPRANSEEPDPVMFGFPIPITQGGFWFGGAHPPVSCVGNPRAICHPGQGNSIGWADPDLNLAVAICHNRLFNPTSVEEDPLLPIAQAVRQALAL